MGMKNLLVIKVAALGDIIMMLPSLRYMKKKYPQLRITLAVGSMAEPFLKYYPEIDRVIFINEKRILTGNIFLKIFEIIKFWFKIMSISGVRVFISHSDFKYSVLVPFWKHQKFHPIRGRHHSDEYARHLDPDFNGELSFSPRRNVPFLYDVVLAPGGAKNLMRDDFLRRWPIENYVSVAKYLSEKGYKVALMGSESDSWVNVYFTGLKVENFIGRFNIEKTLELIESSRLLISHDSGPIHFGNLMGSAVLSIFGPTLAQEKIPVSHPLSFYFQGGKDLTCSPCYDGRNYAVCSRALCMEDVKPAQVYLKAEELIRAI
jgi:heptosyltransferase-2